ncbi:hypothetical protein Bca101_020289 [Brassica carinata]
MKGLVFTKPKPEVEFRSILYVPPVSPMGKLVREVSLGVAFQEICFSILY